MIIFVTLIPYVSGNVQRANIKCIPRIKRLSGSETGIHFICRFLNLHHFVNGQATRSDTKDNSMLIQN